MKTVSIKVKDYTKERIEKHSRRLEMTQGNFVELCVDVAEKANFVNEYPTEYLIKFQRNETNRIIGFIKTQDKNLVQVEHNIYHFLEKHSGNNLEEFLKILSVKLRERILSEIADKQKAESTFERIFNMIIEIKNERF